MVKTYAAYRKQLTVAVIPAGKKSPEEIAISIERIKGWRSKFVSIEAETREDATRIAMGSKYFQESIEILRDCVDRIEEERLQALKVCGLPEEIFWEVSLSQFYNEVVKGLEPEAQETGLDILECLTERKNKRILERLRAGNERNV